MPHPPQIPLTPQTDERNFPRWEGENAPPGRPGARYPKMLTRPVTKEDRLEHREKNLRHENGREYYQDVPPRLNAQIPLKTTDEMVDAGMCERAGDDIIAESKEHEERILQFLGLLKPTAPPATVAIPIRGNVSRETPPQDVVSEWVDAPAVPVMPDQVYPAQVKRRGRPPGSKNKNVNVGN